MPIFGEYVPSTSVKIFVLAILLFAICLHTVALICCCNKYHHKGDPRILKVWIYSIVLKEYSSYEILHNMVSR